MNANQRPFFIFGLKAVIGKLDRFSTKLQSKQQTMDPNERAKKDLKRILDESEEEELAELRSGKTKRAKTNREEVQPKKKRGNNNSTTATNSRNSAQSQPIEHRRRQLAFRSAGPLPPPRQQYSTMLPDQSLVRRQQHSPPPPEPIVNPAVIPYSDGQQQQRYNRQEMREFRQRVIARRLEFAASRIPIDAQHISDMAYRTSASDYLWAGWEEGDIMPRFVGVLQKREVAKTKAGLPRITLTFHIHSAESIIIYGWSDAVEALEHVTEIGRHYSLYNLKCMANMGEKDGTRQDRGSDMPYRLLFESGSSRWHFGIPGESASDEFFRRQNDPSRVARPTIEEVHVSSDTDEEVKNKKKKKKQREMELAGNEPDEEEELEDEDEQEEEEEYEDEENSEEEEENGTAYRPMTPPPPIRKKYPGPPAVLPTEPTLRHVGIDMNQPMSSHAAQLCDLTGNHRHQASASNKTAEKKKKKKVASSPAPADPQMPQENAPSVPMPTPIVENQSSSTDQGPTNENFQQYGCGRSSRRRRHRRHMSSAPTLSRMNNSEDDEEEERLAALDRADLDRYLSIDQWERTGSASRGTVSEQCTVRFRAFDESARPEGLLAICIERLFERVLAGRPTPLRVGFQLLCPNFEKPFYVPLRPPGQNTPQVIADALLDVCAQSGDDADIFSDAVQTKVLAVFANTHDGDNTNRRVGGACSADTHGLGQPLLCRSLVRVQNPDDRFCLARAILLGLMDRRCRLANWTRRRFAQMCEPEQQHGQGLLAQQLLLRAKCRLDKQHYGLADLRRIQRALDEAKGPGAIRLVVFDQQSAFKILWKGPHRARFNLCLVYNAEHFDYVAQPEQLLKARAYCVECESRVTHRSHPDGCKAVCTLCYRFGMEQPCRRDGTPMRRCALCGFHFANADCFAAHRRHVDPVPPGFLGDRRRGTRPRQSLCQQRWVCERNQNCGAVVWARSRRPHHCGDAHWAALRAQRGRHRRWHQLSQHQQQQQICPYCLGAHAPELPCFIQPKGYEKQCQLWTPPPPQHQQQQLQIHNDDDDGPPLLMPEVAAAAAATVVDDQRRQQHHRRRRRQQLSVMMPPVLEQQQMGTGEGQQQQQQQRAPIRFLWWDIETCLDPPDVGTKHVPILICAEVLCEICIGAGVRIVENPDQRPDGCKCGALWQPGGRNRARWCMPMAQGQAQLTIDGRNPRRFHFHNFGGDDTEPMVQFADYLLHHGDRQVTTIALSHNGGGYDMHFLLEELQRRGEKPTHLLSTGLKFYMLELGGKNRRHVLSKDTLHFFSCRLADLPRTFGLSPEQCTAKPYFPYGWVSREHLHLELDGLPPLEFYEPDRMSPADRALLLRWYAEQQFAQPHPLFQLARELLDYCSNDVAILRESVLGFRLMIGQISGGLEPFLVGSSIAGLAVAIYRKCYLPRDRLAHTPEGGLMRGRRASVASRRFFALLETIWPTARIRHAQWSIGEEQPDDSGLRIDGVWRRRAPLRPLALEFLGCYYHGCPDCYPQREQRLAGGQTAATLWTKTEARRAELEGQHGYTVRHIRECRFNNMLKRNAHLRALYAEVDVVEPLDLRKHAYFGGRVEPFHFYHRCTSPDEQIVLLDIVSLYPWAMKYGEFPVGNPRVWTREELRPRHSTSLPWRRPAQLPYRGFIQCRVLAPRRMPNEKPPLLPYRTSDHRLTFPLCAACAEHCQQQPCRHGRRQRSWIAAYGHEALRKALSLGYRVLDLFEMWEYERWASLADGDGGLFGGYVNAFLKLKAESSGWPPQCKTPAEREVFLREFEAREGVRLDPAKLDHPNPVLRHIAKLMLNSLYGKFGQRADRTTIQYTATPREFHELVLEDPSLEVLDFVHVGERMDRVVTRKKTPFVEAP